MEIVPLEKVFYVHICSTSPRHINAHQNEMRKVNDICKCSFSSNDFLLKSGNLLHFTHKLFMILMCTPGWIATNQPLKYCFIMGDNVFST